MTELEQALQTIESWCDEKPHERQCSVTYYLDGWGSLIGSWQAIAEQWAPYEKQIWAVVAGSGTGHATRDSALISLAEKLKGEAK